MNRAEMEARANAEADKVVTDAWGEEELELRKDAAFHKTMWLLLDAEGKRLRGEAT